ncbi:hypothetical protein WCO01_19530 [Weissella confusa]|nr:hypothetical protein WCO01_19530 [Weissella confusa]
MKRFYCSLISLLILMIYELRNNLESAYMVHEYRMQGAGRLNYYDRVPKLKQRMCGGIGKA